MSDADHTPKAGCTGKRCGVAGDEANCPFAWSPKQSEAECEHEWRHLMTDRYVDESTHKTVSTAYSFYCIHCLEIRKL